MDRRTYNSHKSALELSLIENRTRQKALYNNRDNPLLQDSDTLNSLIDEQDAIHDHLETLEKSVEGGFDYTRPDGDRIERFINRLLPPVMPAQKDVADGIFDTHRPRLVKKAVVSALVTVAAMSLYLVLFPVAIATGIMPALFDLALTPDLIATATAVVFIGIISVGLLLSPLLSNLRYTPAIETHKRFYLGAEDWTPQQRLQSSVAYSVASLHTLVWPLIAIPFRFALSLMAMKIYVAHHRQSLKADEAFVASFRFADIFDRTCSAILGALLMAICFNLLQS